MVADSFKLIGITLPDIIKNEAGLIECALDCGIDRIHVRKPRATAAETASLIEAVPSRLHSRLSLHDHHELIGRFPDVWPHLNARNPHAGESGGKCFSRSCHTFEELTKTPRAAYSFLSPIFDSISKSGYGSGFTLEDLEMASAGGLVNRSVIALGGVTPERLPIVRRLGFGGAAMLGFLWADLNLETIKKRIDAAIYYTQK